MSRVSTTGNFQSALLNLMASQQQQADAANRVSTQKNATDLTGFGRSSETLTALKAASSRVQGFIDTGEVVGARLEAQDLALNQMIDGIGGAREAIGGVLASDSAGTLMLELEGQFASVTGGLNARHQGGYLFGGANTTQQPVSVATLSDLAAAPTVAGTFNNDTIKPVSRVAENTSIETGYLASDLGSTIFQIFKDIKAYNDNPATGPLTGKPTDAQKAFLTAQLSRLDAAKTATVDTASRNGSLQKRVEQIGLSHTGQLTSLDEMVSKRTDADLAKAVTDLQLSQIAVQASAQVVSQLRDVSLLNYLR
ncbi:flagellin [Brevundimonas subvibrioides]|uniref:Flagellin domain protein n=1 Tax=Brevundimonas subvibrioides (strain ATCC 15264 / DSM 4735 / LMG 14903 / NBRC 16000 / CB 81) TaxID=633149 RepID=D9QGE6_BRESC|nr:flagellin [Brevundimonas subvibrioides]ADL00762.1 flagellin domain protein [Brevundimonas subvibrioides ATCC 15264]